MEAVLAIVIATLAGYWADAQFGTSPRWLIVGVIVGFGAFVLRLARMAKLIDEPDFGDEEDPRSPDRDDSRAGPEADGPQDQDPQPERENEEDGDWRA